MKRQSHEPSNEEAPAAEQILLAEKDDEALMLPIRRHLFFAHHCDLGGAQSELLLGGQRLRSIKQVEHELQLGHCALLIGVQHGVGHLVEPLALRLDGCSLQLCHQHRDTLNLSLEARRKLTEGTSRHGPCGC